MGDMDAATCTSCQGRGYSAVPKRHKPASKTCPRCEGEGAKGILGNCKLTHYNMKHVCLLCKGLGDIPQSETWGPCVTCSMKGAISSDGYHKGQACELWDMDASTCTSCQGKGYVRK